MPSRKGTQGETSKETKYTVYKDLAYVADAAPHQDLDIYIPDGEVPSGGWAIVVYAHGGGFVAGDKENTGQALRFPLMALDHGFAMASINYRLLGRGIEEVALEIADVQASLRFLAAHAVDFGINKDKIVLMGASAGGALVCAAATRAHKEGETPVLAVVSVASATGISKAAEDVDAFTPPFYIIHGTADSIVPVSQAESLAAALGAAGIPHVFEAVEGGEHTRPIDHPNTMTLLEEQGKLDEPYQWLKGLLAH